MVINKITLRSTAVAADLQVCPRDRSLGRAKALQLRSAAQEGVKIIPARASGTLRGDDYRDRGSSASRRPSPKKVKLSISKAMAAAGKVTTQVLTWMKS